MNKKLFSHLEINEGTTENGEQYRYGTSKTVYDSGQASLNYEVDLKDGSVIIEVAEYNYFDERYENALFEVTEDTIPFLQQMIKDVENAVALKRLRKASSSDAVVEDITGEEQEKE